MLNNFNKDSARLLTKQLTTPELALLVRTSQASCHLYQPLLNERKKDLATRKILHHLVRGEDEAVCELLRNDIDLLYQRSSISDLSDRTFASISPWEYIVWALDKHMCDKVLDLIPQDTTSKNVLTHLISQHNALPIEEKKEEQVQIKGVRYTYKLYGEIITVTETHYDFAIINALQVYLDCIRDFEVNELRNYERWKQLGMAQRLLPVHVVEEYCSDECFYPIPQFDTRPIPAEAIQEFFYLYTPSKQQFFNIEAWEPQSWFNSPLREDSYFAIVKVSSGQGPVIIGVLGGLEHINLKNAVGIELQFF